MSWGINNKCYTCKKYDEKCLDAPIIERAIDVIHLIGFERGHLGAGLIVMECQNFEEKKEEAK